MVFTLSSLIPWGKKSGSITTAGDLYKALFNQQTSNSGIAITRDAALRVSTVFACARVIAEGLAQVPLKLNKKRPAGRGSDPAEDHPLYELLYLKPNEWQTSFELREQLGLHLAIHSNAYVYKVRGLQDKIVELLPFAPESVRVIRDGWNIRYEVWDGNGKKQYVAKEDMWHIRGPSWDGVIGMDAIRLTREAIGLALATEKHSAKMFENGTRLSGVLSSDASYNPDTAKDIRDTWQEMQGGLDNAYKTAVLFGGMKWQPMSYSSVDSQHLEQRRFQVEEICRALRVLPIMIGHADKTATYASAEQMFLAHLVHTMMPWYTRIEQSIAVNLLTEQDRAAGYFPKHNVNALMRGTFADRAKFYQTLYNVASLNPNEIRAYEDMNPYDGGDEYRAPMNMEVPGDTTDETNQGRENATNDPAP
jgi:HK97 family phage portal protein